MKTLVLILLASGRRISEIANLSNKSFSVPDNDSIFIQWLPGFSAKSHSQKFSPEPPSIEALNSPNPNDNLLCPVRAFRIYLERISKVPKMSNIIHLWDHGKNKGRVNIQKLSRIFIKVVEYSRIHSGIFENTSVGPHQSRKWAASYGSKLCNNESDEIKMRVKMGFSSLNILRKVYIHDVPPLTIACVFPGGTYLPNTNYKYYREGVL